MHSIRNAPARTLVRPANIDCRSTADRILDIITHTGNRDGDGFGALEEPAQSSSAILLTRAILNERIGVAIPESPVLKS
jgi:hypothetical protein